MSGARLMLKSGVWGSLSHAFGKVCCLFRLGGGMVVVSLGRRMRGA